MINKQKLTGTNIYIDGKLTRAEKEIQRTIREISRVEQSKGKKVKVRYKKMEIEGKTLQWSEIQEKYTKN